MVGVFSGFNISEKILQCPRTFWYIAEQEAPRLSQLALKLNGIPASSADIERLFSNWGFIHNRLRNRLSSTTSKKLLDIYYFLRQKVKHENQDY